MEALRLHYALYYIMNTMKISSQSHRPPGRLGGILRRRREQLGLSKREAARRIGISPSYLVALEQGRNPSTGRAPVPSPVILAAMARLFEVELGTLLEASGAPTLRSVHGLLYQTGARHRSALDAARRLFAGQVDSWIEVVDPRRADHASLPKDVLVRKSPPPGWPRPASLVFDIRRALAPLSSRSARDRRSRVAARLGIIFGASSAALRSTEAPVLLLESETTWERDVAAEFRAGLGIEPAANLCVYRQTDIEELATRLDPLATNLSLVRTHPLVAVEEVSGALTTGPAAIETIVAAARPAGVSSETWQVLARAAGVGLARAATTAHS